VLGANFNYDLAHGMFPGMPTMAEIDMALADLNNPSNGSNGSTEKEKSVYGIYLNPIEVILSHFGF